MPSLPGVDEKAIAKGHSYMTLVCDLQAARVEYIGEERRKSSLAAYFQAFPQQRRQQIEVIRFPSCAMCLRPWIGSESASTRG